MLGEHPNGIGAWDERDLALVNGPITAVKVWTNNCGIEGYGRWRKRPPLYFFSIMLSHTNDLVTRPCDIRAVAISYVGLNISSA